MAKEDLNTLRKRSHYGVVTDKGGNSFLIQDDDSILFLGGPSIDTTKGKVLTTKSSQYGTYVDVLLKDTAEDDLSYDASETFLHEFGTPRPDFSRPPGEETGGPGYTIDESKRYEDVQKPTLRQPGETLRPDQRQIQKELFDLEPERHEAALAAARQAELERAQMRRTAGALGPAAIIGALDLAIAMRPTEMDKRVAERKLEAQTGPLVPAEQIAMVQDMARQGAAGVGALAKQSEDAESARQAAQGGTTSARAGVLRRRERAGRVDEAKGVAGQQLSSTVQALMERGRARKEKVLDAVARYQGGRQMQKRGAVSKFGADLGKVLGPIAAQKSVTDPGLVQPLGVIAKNSGVLLQDEDYTAISRALKKPGGLSEKEIKDLLEDYKLDPTDEAISSLTRRV